jgi:hypothetical protein
MENLNIFIIYVVKLTAQGDKKFSDVNFIILSRASLCYRGPETE